MTKIYLYISLLLVALTCGLYSCADNTQEGPLGPRQIIITVSPTEVELLPTETQTFTAVGGTGTYFWEVSQDDIGSIDSTGVFTAHSDGEVTIICTDTERLIGEAKVIVNKNTVRVTPEAPTVGFKSTYTFTAAGGTSETYFWSCEPPTLYGTISQQGIYTSKSTNGRVVIKATDGSDNVGTAQLTIRDISITVSPSVVALDAGDTQEFEALGGTEEYSWVSSDTSVGTVEATGSIVTFTAVGEGATTITVTDSDNFTGSAKITVLLADTTGTVVVSPTSVSVAKEGTYQFAAAGGIGTTYTWTISDPSLGTVSSDGLFTAGKNSGSATITATDPVGNVGTATVAVINETISIAPSSPTLTVGGTVQLVGTGGTSLYWWSTTDSTKASLATQTAASATATLTGVSSGSATVFAVDDSGNSGSVTVTVKGASLSVTPTTDSIMVGNTADYQVSGGTSPYTWSSSNTSVATVSGSGSVGTMTGVAEGTATVIATDADGLVGTATLTVTASTATAAVAISPTSVSVEKTDTYQFSATGGTGTYTWNLSNTSVGSIAASGLFTASTTVGTATVTVTDSGGDSATATLNVIAATIAVAPTNPTVSAGSTITLVGTGGVGKYWWSVNDISVATVPTQTATSATVVVTGVATGTTTLYALDDNGDVGTTTITVP